MLKQCMDQITPHERVKMLKRNLTRFTVTLSSYMRQRASQPPTEFTIARTVEIQSMSDQTVALADRLAGLLPDDSEESTRLISSVAEDLRKLEEKFSRT